MASDAELPFPSGGAWAFTAQSPTYEPHRHDLWEANLVVRGRGRYVVGERRVDLQPGSLVWLCPDDDHVLVSRTSDFSSWVAVFKPSLVRRHLVGARHGRLASRSGPEHPSVVLPLRDVRALNTVFGTIAEAETDIGEAGVVYVMLLAASAFERARGQAERVLVHPAVGHAVRMLRAAPDTATSSLARRSGLSSGRLARLFRAQLGLSLVDFRNRTRLEAVLDRLHGGERQLTLLALEAGFGSYNRFHAVFRAQMGMSPREYLALHLLDEESALRSRSPKKRKAE